MPRRPLGLRLCYEACHIVCVLIVLIHFLYVRITRLNNILSIYMLDISRWFVISEKRLISEQMSNLMEGNLDFIL